MTLCALVAIRDNTRSRRELRREAQRHGLIAVVREQPADTAGRADRLPSGRIVVELRRPTLSASVGPCTIAIPRAAKRATDTAFADVLDHIASRPWCLWVSLETTVSVAGYGHRLAPTVETVREATLPIPSRPALSTAIDTRYWQPTNQPGTYTRP